GFVSAIGTGWSCSLDDEVICTNPGPIAPGASSTITLTVNVTALAAPSETNTATVVTAGDANASNNSAGDFTVVNHIPPVIDLSIFKRHTGSFNVGNNGVYAMTVTNVGTLATTGAITVVDTLPTGLEFVSSSGFDWNCSVAGQVVICTKTGPIPGNNSN